MAGVFYYFYVCLVGKAGVRCDGGLSVQLICEIFKELFAEKKGAGLTRRSCECALLLQFLKVKPRRSGVYFF